MQKLSEKLRNTPTSTSLARSNCDPVIKHGQNGQVLQSLKTVSNGSEERRKSMKNNKNSLGKKKSKGWCKKHSEILKREYKSGKIKSTKGIKKMSQDAREKIRQANLGKNNPMYGKKRLDISEMNKQRVNPMYGKHHSEKNKEKISKSLSEGYANGKIKINNQFKTGYYNGEWYASSYELEYMKLLDRNRIIWTKRHGIRIPYLWNNSTRYYVPDFLEQREKIMITEVKGRVTKKDEIKFQALQKYCRERNYDCQIITLENGKWIRILTKAGETVNTNIKNVEVLKYGKIPYQ